MKKMLAFNVLLGLMAGILDSTLVVLSDMNTSPFNSMNLTFSLVVGILILSLIGIVVVYRVKNEKLKYTDSLITLLVFLSSFWIFYIIDNLMFLPDTFQLGWTLIAALFLIIFSSPIVLIIPWILTLFSIKEKKDK